MNECLGYHRPHFRKPSMEAPVSIFNRNLLAKSHLLKPPPPLPLAPTYHRSITATRTTIPFSLSRVHSSLSPISSSPKPSTPFNFLLSLSSAHSSSLPFNVNCHPFIRSNPNDAVFSWHRAPYLSGNPSTTVLARKSPAVTVVLLGWLGSRQKHLKKYVEWYNSQGIHAVTFVVDMRELFWVDAVKNVERRITALANEIISWVSGSEEDGRERCLVFHTFSNTGWLVYGYILDMMKDEEGLVEKIRGCVADSGGGGLLDPKVWAAGFCAAVLKKRSSRVLPAVDANETNKSAISQVNETKLHEKEPPMLEAMLLSGLEKLFSVVLKLPDVDQTLQKVVSALSKKQPSCPQLFLYSTADKLVPYELIESLVEDEKSKGRKVLSHNFLSSPHVDHYRSFPDTYSSLLHNFLKFQVVSSMHHKEV